MMFLLNKAGFSTRYMNKEFKELGAGMRERSGLVEDWVRSLNFAEISNKINYLKKKIS